MKLANRILSPGASTNVSYGVRFRIRISQCNAKVLTQNMSVARFTMQGDAMGNHPPPRIRPSCDPRVTDVRNILATRCHFIYRCDCVSHVLGRNLCRRVDERLPSFGLQHSEKFLLVSTSRVEAERPVKTRLALQKIYFFAKEPLSAV